MNELTRHNSNGKNLNWSIYNDQQTNTPDTKSCWSIHIPMNGYTLYTRSSLYIYFCFYSLHYHCISYHMAIVFLIWCCFLCILLALRAFSLLTRWKREIERANAMQLYAHIPTIQRPNATIHFNLLFVIVCWCVVFYRRVAHMFLFRYMRLYTFLTRSHQFGPLNGKWIQFQAALIFSTLSHGPSLHCCDSTVCVCIILCLFNNGQKAQSISISIAFLKWFNRCLWLLLLLLLWINIFIRTKNVDELDLYVKSSIRISTFQLDSSLNMFYLIEFETKCHFKWSGEWCVNKWIQWTHESNVTLLFIHLFIYIKW